MVHGSFDCVRPEKRNDSIGKGRSLIRQVRVLA